MKLYSQVIPHYFSCRPGYSPAVICIKRAIADHFGESSSEFRMLDLGAGFGVQALEFAAAGKHESRYRNFGHAQRHL